MKISKNPVAYLGVYSLESDDEDYEVSLPEWTRDKKTILLPWVKKETPGERSDFDINKANKIFDLLLQKKHIHLPPNHILSRTEEN
jgi:hypothetical protein